MIKCFEEIALRYLMRILFELRELKEGKKLKHKDWEEMQKEMTSNLPTEKDEQLMRLEMKKVEKTGE